VDFTRAEGIIPGPEPTHAVASAMLEAEKAKETGEEKVIVFNLSGHGHFDMAAYTEFLSGDMVDYEYPQERIEAAMEKIPAVS
jgi:tryptophan synthase beta chain